MELVRLLQWSARGYPRSAHHVLLAHRPVSGEPGEPLAMTGWDHTRTGAWYSHHFPSLSFLRLELSGRSMLQPCFYQANCHDHHSLVAKWFSFIHVPNGYHWTWVNMSQLTMLPRISIMTITSTSALLFSQGNLNTVWPWNSWQHSNAERNETTRDDHFDFVPGPHALSHLRHRAMHYHHRLLPWYPKNGQQSRWSYKSI